MPFLTHHTIMTQELVGAFYFDPQPGKWYRIHRCDHGECVLTPVTMQEYFEHIHQGVHLILKQQEDYLEGKEGDTTHAR